METKVTLLSLKKDGPERLATLNPFRYRGYVYDAETGLYYLNARYYDPETERFISSDSLLENRSVIASNLFTYCGNNPVTNTDQNGHFFLTALAAVAITSLVVGTICGGVGAASAAAQGKSVAAGFVTGFVAGAAATAIAAIAPHVAVAAVATGVATAGCNVWNQYWNYSIERERELNNKKISYGNSKKSSSSKQSSKQSKKGSSYSKQSSGKPRASECGFLEYCDWRSVAISGTLGAVWQVPGNYLSGGLNAAFKKVDFTVASCAAVQFFTTGQATMLESICEFVIDIFL